MQFFVFLTAIASTIATIHEWIAILQGTRLLLSLLFKGNSSSLICAWGSAGYCIRKIHKPFAVGVNPQTVIYPYTAQVIMDKITQGLAGQAAKAIAAVEIIRF